MIRMTLASIALLGLAAPSAAQPDYPVACRVMDELVEDVDSADFDLDGLADLVIFDRGRITILRGNGDGTFETWQEIDEFLVQGGFVRDVDGDGDPDIVAVAHGPAELVAWRLEPDDTFAPFATSPTSITILGGFSPADLDGDGDLDVVYTHAGTLDIITRLGNGDGTFGPESAAASDRAYRALDVADVDADGRDDVVLGSHWTDEFELRLALPGGALGGPTILSSQLGPFGSTSGDFDGDGTIDLLLVHETAPHARLLLGIGDGTFVDAGEIASSRYAYDYQAVDADGDGDLDLVSLGFERIAVHLNSGTGEFTLGASSFGWGARVHPVELNGDGQLDVVTHGFEAACVHLSAGGGGFDQNWEAATPEWFAERVAVGRASLDGYDDVAIICDQNSLVAAYHGGPDSVTLDQTFPVSEATDLLWSDLDGDGDDELIVAESDAHRVAVFWNLGGFLANAETFPVAPLPFAVAVGDVNEDGRPDILAASRSLNVLSVLLAVDGDTFADAIDVPSMAVPTDLALADANGDGHLDAIVAGASGVYVHFGFGDGVLSSPAHPFSTSTTSIDAGDLDGDGRAEIVATGASYPLIVLRSTGLTQFTVELQPALAGAQSLRLADLEGDGALDLVFAIENDRLVAVHAGNGDGTLAPAAHYLARSPRSIDVGDVNGDGALDLAAIDWSSSTERALTVLPRFTTVVGDPPQFLRGDTNQDGAVDIADPVELLGQLFSGISTTCVEASDANDDGARDVADAVYLLSALFAGGTVPPTPYLICGIDPTTDLLSCTFHSACP